MREFHCMAEFVVGFRQEAITKLGLDANQILRNLFTNIIISFRDYSVPAACKVLTNLLYEDEATREETVLKLFEHRYFSPMEKLPDFTEEQIKVLANELRYQYAETYPTFLVIENQPRYQNELNALKIALSNHPVLLFNVVEHCKLVCHTDDITYTTVACLLSENPSLQCDGLKMLGFTLPYKDFLCPYAKEIAQLLDAMHNAYKKEQELLAARQKDDKFHTPFTPLTALLKQNQSEKVKCEDTTSDKYSLSDELAKFIEKKSEIIWNIPRSDEFWICIQQLRQLGIKLNLLIEQKEYLCPILEALSKLDKAITSLYNADQNYKTSRTKVCTGANSLLRSIITNPDEVRNMFNCGEIFQEAKTEYNSAFDTFVACCEAFSNASK